MPPTKPHDDEKSFEDVCNELGIGEFAERIFNSHSHGELFHLSDYYVILSTLRIQPTLKSWFPAWFRQVVKNAEDLWDRPESIFQHIRALLTQAMEQELKERKE